MTVEWLGFRAKDLFHALKGKNVYDSKHLA